MEQEQDVLTDELADIITDKTWAFAPTETLQDKRIYPNQRAYSETRATLCLVAKRSVNRADFAVSELASRASPETIAVRAHRRQTPKRPAAKTGLDLYIKARSPPAPGAVGDCLVLTVLADPGTVPASLGRA